MLGFHRRTRSLIPVKDLAKYDRVPAVDSELHTEDECSTLPTSNGANRSRSKQLLLVYLIFVAEAIMASSLQPQLQMLLSSSGSCDSLSSSYLSSILHSSYAFGGTTGVFWGYLSDRMGRRRITLLGLWSMCICCLGMGFATSLASCAVFGFFAGMISSTIICTSLTMIGDLSTTADDRARNVARLPLASLCGSMGPIMQDMVSESLQAYGMVWEKFPTLGSELACAGLLFGIALMASFLLEETLVIRSDPSADVLDVDSEQAAFLTRPSEDTNMTLVDFGRPEPISIANFLQAPSLMVLLSAYCLLSLHASAFDVLLPHLDQSRNQRGGMDIPCDWLSTAVLVVRGLAVLVVALATPVAVRKHGVLGLFRCVSCGLPVVYVLAPLLAVLVGCSGLAPIMTMFSLLTKHLLAGGASVLVALLVLNNTPDAYSTGTVVGMMQVASLFKAFAVAVSGTSFYVSDEANVQTANVALWICAALFGAAGAGLAWFVRERGSVETDFPSEVLCWEMCFDADSEKQLGLYVEERVQRV